MPPTMHNDPERRACLCNRLPRLTPCSVGSHKPRCRIDLYDCFTCYGFAIHKVLPPETHTTPTNNPKAAASDASNDDDNENDAPHEHIASSPDDPPCTFDSPSDKHAESPSNTHHHSKHSPLHRSRSRSSSPSPSSQSSLSASADSSIPPSSPTASSPSPSSSSLPSASTPSTTASDLSIRSSSSSSSLTPSQVSRLRPSHAAGPPPTPRGSLTCIGLKLKHSKSAYQVVSHFAEHYDEQEKIDANPATVPPFTRVSFPVSRSSNTRAKEGKQCISPFHVYIKTLSEDDVLASSADRGMDQWMASLTPEQREARLKQVAEARRLQRANGKAAQAGHAHATGSDASSSVSHSFSSYLHQLREKRNNTRKRLEQFAGGARAADNSSTRAPLGVAGWLRVLGSHTAGLAQTAKKETRSCLWTLKWNIKHVKNTVTDKHFSQRCVREVRHHTSTALSAGSHIIKGSYSLCGSLVKTIKSSLSQNHANQNNNSRSRAQQPDRKTPRS